MAPLLVDANRRARLEAATSRLEDIAEAHTGMHEAPSGRAPGAAAAGAAAGGAAGAAGGAASGPSGESAAAPPRSPAVSAWDEEVVPALQRYVDLSRALGPLPAEQAEHVQAAFQEVRSIVQQASACKKPQDGVASPAFAGRLKPLQEQVLAISEVRDKNRGDKQFFNHLSAVSEGAPAAGWIAVEPKPGPYISDMKDGAQFYTNRVIKEHKEGDKQHVEWSRAFMGMLDTLKSYVMQHHTTGLAWNPNGVDVTAYEAPAGTAPAAAPAAAGAPPPPPPPPPAGVPPAPAPPAAAGAAGAAGAAAGAGGMEAVFNEINQGEEITRSLRKVDASQMTHKNPSLRTEGAAGGAPEAAPSKPRPAAKPASFRAKKPPSKVLEGNKWTVENFEGEQIVIDGTELSHTINIFACNNCVIQVKGKVNAVSLVSCHKTSIVIDTLVSSLEVTRCASFTAQVTGRTPTILIDNTDGGQVYLSEEGLATDVITAKSSSLNVSVPVVGGEPGEFEELALPEQLKHTLARSAGNKPQLKSEVVQHVGSS